MDLRMRADNHAANLLRVATNAVMSVPGEVPEACRQGGKTVGKPSPEKRRDDREKAARVTEQLSILTTMTTADLAAKFEALTGRPARTRNRQWLRKRVAWHIQAAEYGGLSEAALAKIDELAPLAMKLFAPGAKRRATRSQPAPAATKQPTRDPRLPEPGALLRRVYEGRVIEVTVSDDAFVMNGTRYRSLSKIAREVTGTPWNGFAFFGLGGRAGKGQGAA